MSSRTAKPRSRALLRIRSRCKPWPSSPTSIRIEPPWCAADSVIVPCGVLPAASRLAGVSIPWSALLRTRCVSGSMIFSISPYPVRWSRRPAQLDLLVKLGSQIADHPGEAIEHERHGDHPDRHHRLLQVTRIALQIGRSRPAVS